TQVPLVTSRYRCRDIGVRCAARRRKFTFQGKRVVPRTLLRGSQIEVLEVSRSVEICIQVGNRVERSAGAAHAELGILLLEIREPHVSGLLDRLRKLVQRQDWTELILRQRLDDPHSILELLLYQGIYLVLFDHGIKSSLPRFQPAYFFIEVRGLSAQTRIPEVGRDSEPESNQYEQNRCERRRHLHCRERRKRRWNLRRFLPAASD